MMNLMQRDREQAREEGENESEERDRRRSGWEEEADTDGRRK